MINQTFTKFCKDKTPQCANWLKTFEECVQARDYDRGKALFQNELLCYGTVVNEAHTLENLVASQWFKVWEATEGFRFHLDDTHILGDDDSPVVVITSLWESNSIGEIKQLREGRCTITLVKGEVFTSIHTHFSIKPDGGVVKE